MMITASTAGLGRTLWVSGQLGFITVIYLLIFCKGIIMNSNLYIIMD